MSLSVTAPISPAIERTRWILFRPFDLGKWLRLGFCSFLMGLASGSSGSRFNFSWGGPVRGEDFDHMKDWVLEHLPMIIVGALAIILLFTLIGLVMTWLGSRGEFMFLDGVVHNRGAVVAPWREYRREGNSLFLFKVCLGFGMLGVMLAITVACALVALPDIQNREFSGFSVVAILLGVFSFFAVMLTFAIVSTLLADFVVPIMYLRRLPVITAWRAFHAGLLSGNVPYFVVYLLMKILIGIVVGFCALALFCLTCCIAGLPYIGSVIMLPLSVFLQSYPLYFIEQFGPEWEIFPRFAEPAEANDAPPSGGM
jgi:hypothetical protein